MSILSTITSVSSASTTGSSVLNDQGKIDKRSLRRILALLGLLSTGFTAAQVHNQETINDIYNKYGYSTDFFQQIPAEQQAQYIEKIDKMLAALESSTEERQDSSIKEILVASEQPTEEQPVEKPKKMIKL